MATQSERQHEVAIAINQEAKMSFEEKTHIFETFESDTIIDAIVARNIDQRVKDCKAAIARRLKDGRETESIS